MSVLLADPAASVLDRLFAEAEINMAPVRAEFAQLSKDQLTAMMGSRTDYREFYERMEDASLPVSREEGTLVYMLARTAAARSIVEFGMSFGVSTIYLASALRDNGGGRLITSEFQPSKVTRGRANLEASGLIDLVEVREGDALDTLGRDLPDLIDFVMLDGAKGLYCDILDRLEPRLRAGALVFADNADMCPAYLDRVRSTARGYLSQPFGEAELSVRIC